MVRPLPSTISASGNPTRLCSIASLVHMGLSDFLRPSTAVVLPWDSQRGPQRHLLRPDAGPPGSRAESFRTCTGSSTTRGHSASRVIETKYVAFRSFRHRRHPRSNSLSRLNTWPALTPVNASPASLRLQTHDSGPVWFAKPSPYGTFIHYFPPVSTSAPKLELLSYRRTYTPSKGRDTWSDPKQTHHFITPLSGYLLIYGPISPELRDSVRL